MAIDIKPLSITAMLSSIKSFFQSQENNSKWKDMNTGAEGNFLMRLLANVIAVISSRVMTGRREQFHDTANLMSSQIALAVNNGYPVFRGQNQRRVIQIRSSVNRIIPALSVVGFYGTDYSIVTLEPLTLIEGELTEPFKVVIGALKEIQWQAKTSSLKKFVRHEQKISEDYILYKDGVPVETSKIAKDKIADKYYVYTNPYKSVTIEYLNNLQSSTHKYDTDTVFTLRYIELDDTDYEEFSPEMFNIGQLVNTLTIEPYKPFENIEDIKHNSPVYRETQNLIRSKADWRDMYKEALPAFREVTFRALTPSYTQVSYTKDDFSLLSVAEESEIRNKVEFGRYFGRPYPDVEDPKRELTTLDVVVGIADSFKDEEDVEADIQNIINNMYESKFNQTFNIYDVENEIKKLAYIKYARVSLHSEKRVPFNNYRLGNIITETSTYEDSVGRTIETNKSYRCVAIMGRTGASEPLWQIPSQISSIEQVELDTETIDNELVWACYKRLPSFEIYPWAPETLYTVGDFVYSENCPGFMFKCVDILSNASAVPPDTSLIQEGDFLEDGNLLLMCVAYNSAYQQRMNSYTYRLRTRFNLNGLSFEVVGHIGTSAGTPTLQFTDAIQKLYSIPKEARDNIAPGNLFLDGDFREYISQGDVLQVSMAYTRNIPYEETSEANLKMNSVLNAKVAEYEDEDEEESSATPTSGDTITNTVVNIDINVATGRSGNVIPRKLVVDENTGEPVVPETYKNPTDLEIGETIQDNELTLLRVEHNASYNAWAPNTVYTVGDTLNIGTVSFSVMAASGTKSSGSSNTSTTVIQPSTPSTTPSEPKPDKNAHWKELEAVKEQMEQIQKWIVSEHKDNLRTPADVLAFYGSLGRGSRFTREEIEKLTAYYVEYNKYDEEQIYLHMEQFGSTRLEAIKELEEENQLSAPIADAACLKYYSGEGEDEELVYVDRYGLAEYTDGRLSFNPAYVPNTPNYAVQRENTDGNAVKLTTYVGSTLDVTQYKTVSEDYVKTFMVTVGEVQYNPYPIPGINRELTCIIPTSPVNYYNDGSYINLSYTTTNDGRIKWAEVSDEENISYDWNVYPSVEVNVSVKY